MYICTLCHIQKKEVIDYWFLTFCDLNYFFLKDYNLENSLHIRKDYIKAIEMYLKKSNNSENSLWASIVL